MKLHPIKLALTLIFLSITQINANDVVSQIDKLMKMRYNYDTPGASIMILKGDSIIMENYYGIADMKTGEPITSKTRFNIASISKQFTVVGALKLVAQGKISLNDNLSHFFPEYPQPFWSKIKLWHLMSHTSGLPDDRDRRNRNACVFANDSVSISYFPYIKKLRFSPGKFYDYKNPTFLLIAKIIEQFEDMEFIQFQQQNIFNPLEMNSTFYFNPNINEPNTAHGYINTLATTSSNTDNDTAGKAIVIAPASESQWQEYDYGEETFFATRPDGGIYSTISDLARWEKGLRENIIIPKDLLNVAYQPHITVTGSKWSDYQNRANTYYGLGWFIDKSPGFPIKIYHTGDNGGFQAYLAKYPQHDITIIILENRNDNDRWSLVTAIDEILKRNGLLE